MADPKKEILGTAESPEELADLIDKLMAQGNKHINIEASDSASGSGVAAVRTVKSSDCTGKLGACAQPTEIETEEDDISLTLKY